MWVELSFEESGNEGNGLVFWMFVDSSLLFIWVQSRSILETYSVRLLIELVDEFMLLILSSTKSSNDSSFAVKFDNSDSPPFNATGLLSIFVNSDSLFSKAFNLLSNSAESGNLAYKHQAYYLVRLNQIVCLRLLQVYLLCMLCWADWLLHCIV